MLGLQSRRRSGFGKNNLTKNAIIGRARDIGRNADVGRARDMIRSTDIGRQRGISRNGVIGGVLGVMAAGLLYRAVSRRSSGAGQRLTGLKGREVNLESSITIDRPAEEIYNYWRGFVQLPKVMTFLDRIEDRGGKITHWVARGPLGTTVEWDSEVIDDVPNGRISWQSVEGSDMRTWGSVKFYGKPQKGSTDVVVNFSFEPPGKIVGAAVGKFLSGMENAVLQQNLRNLKAYLETGELPTNRRSGDGRK